MSRILVVEDDPYLLKIIRSYLERERFEVLTAQRGDTGLEVALAQNPDLVLLDLNLPGLDGLDVASELRRHKDIPIIMVTARVEETDRLTGFNTGADDYISKPFSPRELVARVKAVLHRVYKDDTEKAIVSIEELVIDNDRHQVTVAGNEVELTPTEFNMLLKMASNPGRVFTRLQLMEMIPGDLVNSSERSIDVHVKNLRNKLKKHEPISFNIETVFGVGYRIINKK
jgi:DNA-binding response OmpR family regulator